MQVDPPLRQGSRKRSPVNVLHIMSARGLYGAERVLINLVCHDDASSFRPITIILLNEDDPAHEVVREIGAAGKKCIAIPCKRWIDVAGLRKLLHHVREYDIDIIHSHEMKSRLYGLILSRYAGIPLITTHNNWIRGKFLNSLFEYLDAFYIRFCDTIIAVSEGVAAALRQCGVGPHRVRVIPNGVSSRRTDAGDADSLTLRRSLEIGNDSPVIGMVGRISTEKGPRYFIEAAGQVLGSRPDVRFVIVGDGPLRKKMEEYSRFLGISDKLIFAGFRADVASFYALMGICVMPSLREGTPMALLEAMARGLPVIASNVGGIPGIIADRENGLLVSPGKPGEIADRILLLLNDKDLCRRLSRNAQSTVREKFSVERMVSQYEEEYRRLCRGADHADSTMPAAGAPLVCTKDIASNRTNQASQEDRANSTNGFSAAMDQSNGWSVT